MIDPATGDYLMQNGSPISSDSLDNPAYYRIRIHRLKWMYAPDTNYGSDLYTLEKKEGNAALNMITTALQPMVDDGRALGVDPEFVTPQPSSRNEAAISVEITDAQGIQQNLTLPPVGN
jgi:phage gp46-like protein